MYSFSSVPNFANCVPFPSSYKSNPKDCLQRIISLKTQVIKRTGNNLFISAREQCWSLSLSIYRYVSTSSRFLPLVCGILDLGIQNARLSQHALSGIHLEWFCVLFSFGFLPFIFSLPPSLHPFCLPHLLGMHCVTIFCDLIKYPKNINTFAKCI